MASTRRRTSATGRGRTSSVARHEIAGRPGPEHGRARACSQCHLGGGDTLERGPLSATRGPERIGEDLTGLIRRNPIPACWSASRRLLAGPGHFFRTNDMENQLHTGSTQHDFAVSGIINDAQD